MEPKELNNPEEQDVRPDFLKSAEEEKDFGGHANEPHTQENYPELGNQSQSGAATNNSDLDFEPESDGDTSIAGTDD